MLGKNTEETPAKENLTATLLNHLAATAGEIKGNHQGQEEAPLTLAMASQALLREAILTGTANQFLDNVHLWIEKLREFLSQADSGVDAVANIVSIAKEALEKELALSSTQAKAENLSTSFQLLWNLIHTQEFQQFSGRLLA
ncbi:MAG TPA: hypothetical protein ENM97_07035 [Moorella mulderi]|nr:hypothetical protein [Moorella mulderi]